MKRIGALSVVLWAVSWAKADDHAHQMLPLAVGNTWEYRYVFISNGSGPYRPEESADSDSSWPEGLIYIGITHTELIGGHTYYVFGNIVHEEGSPLPQWLSGMGAELEKPPLPFFFLAGKRVRFDGNWLVFNEQGYDFPAFWFGEGEPSNYNFLIDLYSIYGMIGMGKSWGQAIRTLNSSIYGLPRSVWLYDEVRNKLGELTVPFTLLLGSTVISEEVDSPMNASLLGIDTVTRFYFPTRFDYPYLSYSGWLEENVMAEFSLGLGLSACWGILDPYRCSPAHIYCCDEPGDEDLNQGAMCRTDVTFLQVGLFLQSAVIDGVQFGEGAIPTAIQERSWGEVKQTFTSERDKK